MKLVRYQHGGQVHYGVLEGEVITRIEGDIFGSFQKTADRVEAKGVRLLAPVAPSKIVCIGLNYKAHAAESGMEVPAEPLIFLKPPSAVIGPGDEIVYPAISERVDYEGELGIVIGKKTRHVERAKAMGHVLGATCFNDVTARDLQKKDGQFTRSKGFDTFAVIGPCIETEFQHNDVLVETYLKGKRMQSSSTADMVFDVPSVIVHISKVMTLLPGDVVATGTPSGIAPMQVGDEVEVRLSGIGSLVNRVVAHQG